MFGFIALVVGLAVGCWFPDVDQKTGLVIHRSIVTHGPLAPFIVIAVVSSIRTIPVRWFALGLGAGVAVHLSFDLFPKGWSGFALISVPGYGWTPSWFSWIWIALSAIFCVYLARRLVNNSFEGCLLIMSLIGGFGYTSLDEEVFWRPLVALTAAAAIALAPAVYRTISSD